MYEANCQTCHGGDTGGNLRDIPPPHNTNGHTWHHADQQLTDSILHGFSDPLSPQQMPAFAGKLEEKDVRDILAYIKTWSTADQQDWQRQATEQWEQLR